MSFYKPYTTKILDIPIILYPENGLEKIFQRLSGSLENYLSNLYQANNLNIGQYHIVILWRDGDYKMTDVWIFDGLNDLSINPNVRVRNFRNDTEYKNEDITAGDGLVILGREDECRRNSKSLESFIKGQRPAIPFEIIKKEKFYTI
jgi:hypothetical protein